MPARRTDRLNSLLKEVIADVVRLNVRNPQVSELCSVTRVDITRDLRQAKVYVSIIGDEEERESTLKALQTAAGFIAVTASKQIVIRHFPTLDFYLDDTVDKHMQIDTLIKEVQHERDLRSDDQDSHSS